MLVTVLAKARVGRCSTCSLELSVWVCTYDHVLDRGGLNHAFFCDNDLSGELEYLARLGVPINDEREDLPVALRELLAEAYAFAAARAAETPTPAAERIEHFCHRPGCREQVPPRLLACRPHWYELKRGAPEVAQAILSSYKVGQDITKTPSAEYLEAAERAREYWRSKDSLKEALTAGLEDETLSDLQ